jgi:hypothetical protein
VVTGPGSNFVGRFLTRLGFWVRGFGEEAEPIFDPFQPGEGERAPDLLICHREGEDLRVPAEAVRPRHLLIIPAHAEWDRDEAEADRLREELEGLGYRSAGPESEIIWNLHKEATTP